MGGEEAKRGCGSLPRCRPSGPQKSSATTSACSCSSVIGTSFRPSPQPAWGPAMPPQRRYGLAGPHGIHESPSPCPVAYAWAGAAALAQLCAGREPRANPAVMSPPGRANTLLAIVLVPAQPPAEPWLTEWPGKARQSMDSIGAPAWTGCPGKSRPGERIRQ